MSKNGPPPTADRRSVDRDKTPAKPPLPLSQPLRASRHYRRAQRDRGAETRAQLIEAALDVFGRLGFEGATTRAIAKAADANLAAIVYHFGSKEALYIAVAEHVATSIARALEPTLLDIATSPEQPSPQTARENFIRLIEIYVDLLVGSAEAERWARFIVREQMQPSAAFDVIFEFMRIPVDTATRFAAAALGRPEDEETRLRVFALFGQVLVFRVSQALIIRSMGWKSIGPRERDQIKEIITSQVDTVLQAGPSP